MLQWFVNVSVATSVLKNQKQLIEEEQVEVRPEKLPDAVLDENVDVHLIRKYFSHDAWLSVHSVVQQKKINSTFVCQYCFNDADVCPSIACDHCLSWCHMKCVGLVNGPKTKYWFVGHAMRIQCCNYLP